jgi:hypothetical protein
MSKRTGILLVVYLLPCFVLGAERKTPLQSQLESELLGKDFDTKIELANSITGFHGGQFSRAVDTELSPDGVVRYYVTKFLGHPEIAYVSADEITRKLPVGIRVKATKIEFKGDRIEVSLNALPDNSYAKLKLMLGRGFESSYNLETVLGVVSRALRLERFEQLQFLKAEYPQLKAKLALAEADFKSAQGDAPTQLAAARQLQEALGGLVKNRTDYDSLTQTLADPEKEQYARQAADLDKTIQALEQEARKERAEQIRKTLESEGKETSRLKSQLERKKPASLEEWQEQMASLNRLETVLAHRQSLQTDLASTGESATPEELGTLQQDSQEAQKLREALESQRKNLELAQMENQYRDMERKKGQLYDSYTRAFGTPKQGAEAQRLRAHLQHMYENRVAAQKMGSAKASQQATGILKEIQRIK